MAVTEVGRSYSQDPRESNRTSSAPQLSSAALRSAARSAACAGHRRRSEGARRLGRIAHALALKILAQCDTIWPQAYFHATICGQSPAAHLYWATGLLHIPGLRSGKHIRSLCGPHLFPMRISAPCSVARLLRVESALRQCPALGTPQERDCEDKVRHSGSEAGGERDRKECGGTRLNCMDKPCAVLIRYVSTEVSSSSFRVEQLKQLAQALWSFVKLARRQ